MERIASTLSTSCALGSAALAEAVVAFRYGWSRAHGSRSAQDLAAVCAILRRSLTDAQAAHMWQEAASSVTSVAAYMRSIMR